MITLLTVFHVIVCIFLILVVLLQQGKGADWAGALGGGGSQTTFGARGAGTILSRVTTAAAVIWRSRPPRYGTALYLRAQDFSRAYSRAPHDLEQLFCNTQRS